MIILYDNKFTSKLGFGVNPDGFLTEAATVWSEELSDVTLTDLQYGFSQLRSAYPEWPPSVLEFRKLCLSKTMSDVPTLDEVVSILVTASIRTGSLANRYKHPLALAVSQSVEMFSVRTANAAGAKAIIKPVYEKLLIVGWDGFPDAPEHQRAIGVQA
jgi:hypothetical protein